MNIQTHPKHQPSSVPKPKHGVFKSTSENFGSRLKVLGEIFQHKYVAILSSTSPPEAWRQAKPCEEHLCAAGGRKLWAGGSAGWQDDTGGLSWSITHHFRPHNQSKPLWTSRPLQGLTICWDMARHWWHKACLAWKLIQTWSGSPLPHFFKEDFGKRRFSHHNP